MGLPILFCLFIACQGAGEKKPTMTTKRSVRGTVYDRQGRPASDAVIMITGGPSGMRDMASMSDANGQFYLDDLSVPGNYTLQVNWQGSNIEKAVSLAQNDTAFTITL
jgi:hypothetical protein